MISSVLIPPPFVPHPAGPVEPQFVTSQILDVYANALTPRQALGIDPLPAGATDGALTNEAEEPAGKCLLCFGKKEYFFNYISCCILRTAVGINATLINLYEHDGLPMQTGRSL